eukprot:scaffold10267_cov116-Isochrysis_galbana.AAC.16
MSCSSSSSPVFCPSSCRSSSARARCFRACSHEGCHGVVMQSQEGLRQRHQFDWVFSEPHREPRSIIAQATCGGASTPGIWTRG